MTVREELTGFVTMQRLLSRRSALMLRQRTPPEQLVSLRASFAKRREAIALLEKRRDELQREQAALQRESEALREERGHFRKQKSMVTNMKQLAAVVSELDHVESQLKTKEDRLLEVWQELEGIKEKTSGMAEESSEEKTLREEAEAEWAEQRRACDVELTEVAGQFLEVRKMLGKESLARFLKLWESRKPLAVVPMRGDACSACHADLRPSLVQLVRASETMAYCDSCRRLLYDAEQFPEE